MPQTSARADAGPLRKLLLYGGYPSVRTTGSPLHGKDVKKFVKPSCRKGCIQIIMMSSGSLWPVLVSFLGLHASVSSCMVVTNDSSVAAGHIFDYIVAGAGLSGLVVGNKLSGRGYSVLIIEAGPDAS